MHAHSRCSANAPCCPGASQTVMLGRAFYEPAVIGIHQLPSVLLEARWRSCFPPSQAVHLTKMSSACFWSKVF